ncbi:hypothetical protein, partial [Vibrio campbellii]|uniref:hypothetical protein n=1 Tax=Vibrio campbellii TaxID=680 RepID=UPI000AAF3A72
NILNENVDFIFSNYLVFENTNTPEAPSINIKGKIYPVKVESLYYTNPFCHSSMVVKTTVLRELGGYNETLSKLVDYDLYIRAMNHYKFAILRQPLVYKRFHINQSFERSNRTRYIFSILSMQSKNLINSGKLQYFPIIFAKFIYSLLPAKIRKSIKNSHIV